MRKAFISGFAVSAAIVSVPANILLMNGFVLGIAYQIVLGGGTLGLMWTTFYGVVLNFRWAIWLTLLAGSALWFLLLLQTGRRILFIIENDGMEPADGMGSPMAFLIGLLFEQILFLPLCVLVICGWLYVFQRQSSPTHPHAELPEPH